jgi:hypothetical protein
VSQSFLHDVGSLLLTPLNQGWSHDENGKGDVLAPDKPGWSVTRKRAAAGADVIQGNPEIGK